MTAEAKGSTTPGVNHGDIVGNIKAVDIPQKKISFVGINKNAESDTGEKLVDIFGVFEYGSDGPIVPKGHPYLAIPVSKEAQRAGRSPRDFPRPLIFLDDPMTDGAALAEEGEVFGDYEIHYVLLPKVTIEERPTLRPLYKIMQKIGKKEYSKTIEKVVVGKGYGHVF